MNHDFSKSKTGDWAFGNKGWEKIKVSKSSKVYPVEYGGKTYTRFGYTLITDVMPAIFLEPPKEFEAGYPPEGFYHMQTVLVSNNNINWLKRKYKKHEYKKHYCYAEGRDTWVSEMCNETIWKYIKH